MLPIVLFSTAFAFSGADLDVTCPPAHVENTVPSNQQTDVPLDVVPLVTLSTSSCASASYELTLSHGEVVDHIETVSYDWQAQVHQYSFTPPEFLLPDTTYTLTVVPSDGWGESTVVSFETGDGLVTGITGSPSVTVNNATYTEYESHIWVTANYHLSPAEDIDDLSTLQVYYAEEPDVILASYPANTTDLASLFVEHSVPLNASQEFCLAVSQRDGAGNVSTLSTPSCVTAQFDEGKPADANSRGCSVLTPMAPIAMLPVLGLLALRRRRE